MDQGINLIGYARTESGIGQSCRLAAGAMDSAGLPFGILNHAANPSRKRDLTWIHKEMRRPIYNTNLFHINADEMIRGWQTGRLSERLFRDKYNIGYWHWELPSFPEDWRTGFQLVDEIWVPSSFVYQAIVSKTDKPVIKMPHAIDVDVDQTITRRHFKLPDHRFLFLMMYDALSYRERKNPKAAITAFKKAFGHDHANVGLVIKVNAANHRNRELHELKRWIDHQDHIYIMPQILDRRHVNALIHVTDALVSLHRSEGFGLPLAEAMYLGKPVIGTNWSGNTDFMNQSNAYPVPYTLTSVGDNYGPYSANQQWAEPDTDHAAACMRELYFNPKQAQSLGQKGLETMKTDYAPEVMGEKIKTRLQTIERGYQ
ncbi:glycosyltransferase family 4 protein [Tuberibacillus sp. Marseille-P3662]|uniref:glycosyltransferase family 4 protein n=1 Tax=Tuberibacillus sp. Marseille-P3662 TaxID=1965358 RepID=UPI000A1CCAEE|nr:glycosyltransferase family 4 protein [Tuberibacillus sp. Marseille-P3662]